MEKKQEIVRLIVSMSGKYSAQEVFRDWVRCSAIAISNSICLCQDEIWKEREQQYIDTMKKYEPEERCKLQQMFQLLCEELEENMSDVLGDIYMVKLDCYWNRDDRYYKKGNWHGTADLDGGTLYTQFSHFIDIMYWLFGDITNIRGNFNDFNHQNLTAFEDSGVVTFDFINGGMGCLNYSTSVWDTNLESSITIIGSKGTVKVAGQYMNDVVYCHVKDYEMPELAPSNPPNDYGAYKGSAQNHHYVIQNVVEKLTGKTPITTNLLEGLKVVDIIERIYQVRDKEWKKK